jgi:hypothetical protein
MRDIKTRVFNDVSFLLRMNYIVFLMFVSV